MAVDAAIAAIFGSAPDGTDLSASRVAGDNVGVVVVLTLATLAVAMRLFVRRWQRMSLRLDDYAMIVGLAIIAAMSAMCIVAGNYGAGKHVWAITVGDLKTILKIVYSLPFVYAACQTAIKFGILYFYFHIFGDGKPDPLFTYMFYFASFLTGAYPLVLWFTMLGACQPIHYYWDQYTGAAGKCIEVNTFFLVLGIVNMINDMVILAIPIPQIWKLKMDPKKKMGVVGILLLGGFVCVASIIRIYYLALLNSAIDATWAIGPAFVWTCVEPGVGVVSACLPTLAPLFRGPRDGRGTSSNRTPKISMPAYPGHSKSGVSVSGGERREGKREGWERAGSESESEVGIVVRTEFEFREER